MFTTLKALKWAHDLGIRQERTRIAAHLQLKASQIHDGRDTALDMLRENADRKRPSKATAERLKFKLEVEDRVQIILNEMFDEQGGWVAGPSIMFPDDGHKGKVK